MTWSASRGCGEWQELGMAQAAAIVEADRLDPVRGIGHRALEHEPLVAPGEAQDQVAAIASTPQRRDVEPAPKDNSSFGEKLELMPLSLMKCRPKPASKR